MPNYFQCITRAVFNTASITGSYAALNGTGFSDPIKILKVYNGGSNGVDISYDGTTDHDYFPAGSTQIIDFQANHPAQSGGDGILNGQKNQIIYGKGTAGTGNLYITGYK